LKQVCFALVFSSSESLWATNGINQATQTKKEVRFGVPFYFRINYEMDVSSKTT